MNNLTSFLVCIVCSMVVFLTMGVNVFSVYQLLPILIFYFFQVKVFNKSEGSVRKVCYILAFLILLVFPALAQISWYFDINHLASKSSTSGLLFVYLPIYAIIPGIVPCIVAWIVKSKTNK